MKNCISQKELNKMVKGALALVLAGTFTFSATRAFAEETTSQTDQFQTVDLQTSVDTEANSVNQNADTKEAPSLLPGDFFYFAKIALEKIKLALSLDKVKDAQLLTDYASERLAEAQALFDSGDQKTAIEMINQAMEDMNNAEKIVELQKQSEQVSDQANEDSQEAESETSNSDEANKDDEQISTDQKNDETQVTEDHDVNKVDATQSQNIVALTAAMEKVKNPVAKEALQKNINKSYAKLARKLDKLKAREAKHKNKHSETDDSTDQNPVSTIEDTSVTTDTSAAAIDSDPTGGNTTTQSEEPKIDTSMNDKAQLVNKEAQQEVKQLKQTAKQEIKQIQQNAKQQIKQKREEVKSIVKENKADGHRKTNETE